MADRELSLGVVFTGRVDAAFHSAVARLRQGIERTTTSNRAYRASAEGVTKADKRLTGQKEVLTKQIGKVHGGIQRLTAAMKVTASYGLAATAIFSIINAFKGATKAIFDYDQALKSLQAITSATAAEVEVMAVVIKRVASDTKFSTQEVAEAMILLGQAGFSAEEAVDGIQAVAMMATGTLTDMRVAADLLTTTIRAFSLDASESGKVADVFASAINRSKLTVDKLRIAFNYIGPIANKAGIALEETAAAAMILANTGLRASTIGTGLRQVLARLVAPTSKLQAAFIAAGADLSKLNPSMNAFSDVIRELIKVVPTAQKAFELFGLRGASAVSALTEAGVEGFSTMLDHVYRVGTAFQMAEKQMEGLGVMAKNLADRLGLLAVTIGEGGIAAAFRVLLGVLRPLVSLLTVLVGSPIGKAIVAFGSFAAVLGAASLIIRYLVIQLGAIALGMTVSSVKIAIFNKTLGYSNLAVGVLTGTIKKLWALIMAHPILMVASIITGVVASILSYIKHLDDMTVKMEASIIMTNKNLLSLEQYKKKLLEVEAGSREYRATMQRVYEQFGELRDSIDETTWSWRDQGEAMDALIESKKSDKLRQMMELVGEYGKKVERAQFWVGLWKSAWNVFVSDLNRSKEDLREVGSLIYQLFSSDQLTKSLMDIGASYFKWQWSEIKTMSGRIKQYFIDVGEQSVDSSKRVKAAIEGQKESIRSLGLELRGFGVDYTSSLEDIMRVMAKHWEGPKEKILEVANAVKTYYKETLEATLKSKDLVKSLADGWSDLYMSASDSQKAFVLELYAIYKKEQRILLEQVKNHMKAGRDKELVQVEYYKHIDALQRKYQAKLQAETGLVLDITQRTTQSILEELDRRAIKVARKHENALREEIGIYKKGLEGFRGTEEEKTQIIIKGRSKILALEKERVSQLMKIAEARFIYLKEQYRDVLGTVDEFYTEYIEKASRVNESVLNKLDMRLKQELIKIQGTENAKSEIIGKQSDAYVEYYAKLDAIQDEHLTTMVTRTKEAYQKRIEAAEILETDAEERAEAVKKLEVQLHKDLTKLHAARLTDYHKVIDGLIKEEERLTQAIKDAESQRSDILKDAEDILREISYKKLDEEEKRAKEKIRADRLYFDARMALVDGDLKRTKEYAKEAQKIYADIAKAAVEGSGEEELAIEGIKDATDILIEVSYDLQEIMEENKERIITVQGTIEHLIEKMDKYSASVDAASGKPIDINIDAALLALQTAQAEIVEYRDQLDEVDQRKIDLDMSEVLREISDVDSELKSLVDELDRLDGRVITYTINQVINRVSSGSDSDTTATAPVVIEFFGKSSPLLPLEKSIKKVKGMLKGIGGTVKQTIEMSGIRAPDIGVSGAGATGFDISELSDLLRQLIMTVGSQQINAGDVNINNFQGDARALAFQIQKLQQMGHVPSLA